MTIGLSYDELKALAPCKESLVRVRKLMGGAKAWDGRAVTAAEARERGATYDDVLWAASAVARSNPDIERRLRLWMADCAARVLHIYERQAPNDTRVRDAIVAARQYARGEIGAAASTASAARAAARGAARAAARDAAWAAAWDARDARDARVAAWEAARAARAAARDAARAARAAARDAEEAWQFDRLIAWLSDPEPDDWPLPGRVLAEAPEVSA